MTSPRLRILAWPARSNAARNPYQTLLYDAVEASGLEVAEFSPKAPFLGPHYDVLHIHWPDAFLAAGAGWRFWPRLAYLRALALVARLRGARLVWTAHNLQRDDQRHGARMGRLFWPWFLRRVDGVIFMTQASEALAGQTAPALSDTPQATIPHGHYGPVIAPVPDETTAADTPPEALFFGSVTAYKNVWKVLESFLQLPAGRARLAIRGKMSLREPDTRLQAALADLPEGRRAEITFEDRFLPDEDLVAAIRGADLVVFPYGDVLNSGAALFALSAGRPILASDVALFRELQGQVGPDWVRLIKGDLDGGQLAQALDAARALRTSGAIPNLSAFDWAAIGQQTAAFYKELLA